MLLTGEDKNKTEFITPLGSYGQEEGCLFSYQKLLEIFLK